MKFKIVINKAYHQSHSQCPILTVLVESESVLQINPLTFPGLLGILFVGFGNDNPGIGI